MDRCPVRLIGDGNDDIGEIRLCGNPVMFGRDGRVFGMAMINAEHGPVMVKGMLFGGHIVEGGDFEAAGLVPGFGVVDDEDVDDDAGSVVFFPAEQESAAFVGEGIEGVVNKQLSDPGFDDDHMRLNVI